MARLACCMRRRCRARASAAVVGARVGHRRCVPSAGHQSISRQHFARPLSLRSATMVARAQLLLRDLDGRTRVLDLGPRESVPATDVFSAVAAACRLPPAAFRLATGSRVLCRDSGALRAVNGLLPTCSVVLSLCGGKVRKPVISACTTSRSHAQLTPPIYRYAGRFWRAAARRRQGRAHRSKRQPLPRPFWPAHARRQRGEEDEGVGGAHAHARLCTLPALLAA